MLAEEDTKSRARRLRRARVVQQMIGTVPDGAGMLFYGGFEAMQAYREAQATHIAGCFVGCVLLCQVAVEHTLASYFAFEGRDDVATGSFYNMLQAAVPRYLTVDERDALDSIRVVRNEFVHAPKPGKQESLLFRAAAAKSDPYDIIERDATTALGAMLRLFHTPDPGVA